MESRLYSNQKSVRTAVSVSGKVIELISIDHVVFKDVYYIEVDGVTNHMQYGTRKLNTIFNEFVTEEFDLACAY